MYLSLTLDAEINYPTDPMSIDTSVGPQVSPSIFISIACVSAQVHHRFILPSTQNMLILRSMIWLDSSYLLIQMISGVPYRPVGYIVTKYDDIFSPFFRINTEKPHTIRCALLDVHLAFL